MPSALLLLVWLCLTACTETPSAFPPCLDPYSSFMNDCPADAGVDANADAPLAPSDAAAPSDTNGQPD